MPNATPHPTQGIKLETRAAVATAARVSAFVVFVYHISTVIHLFMVSIPLHCFQLCFVGSVYIYVGRRT